MTQTVFLRHRPTNQRTNVETVSQTGSGRASRDEATPSTYDVTHTETVGRMAAYHAHADAAIIAKMTPTKLFFNSVVYALQPWGCRPPREAPTDDKL